MSEIYEHHYLQANGLRFHVVQHGPTDGPLILLLHGFPEFWRAWAAQIDALAGVGYRVWVPDQRGYGESDKPSGVGAYAIDMLADDIAALVRASGRAQITLMGHDWGGAVSWRFAQRYPQLLRRLVIVNSPHPAVMLQHMRQGVQRWRSWYMHFFRIPRLPEALLRYRHFRGLARVLIRTSRAGTFSGAELALYRAAWARPGAVTAMLNWYRALMRQRAQLNVDAPILVPTLLMRGVHDRALGIEMAQPSIARCEAGRLRLIDGAGHWVLHEEAPLVGKHILDFIGPGASATAPST